MRPAVPPFFSPEDELSVRCNGRYPDGARLVMSGSPHRLSAEFESSWPPVSHHHRLALWLGSNLLLRFNASIGREYIERVNRLSTKLEAGGWRVEVGEWG
jgi:hypothetical protein